MVGQCRRAMSRQCRRDTHPEQCRRDTHPGCPTAAGKAKKGTPTPDARRQQGWGRWDNHSGAMSKGHPPRAMSKGHPPRAKKGTPTADARRQQGQERDTHPGCPTAAGGAKKGTPTPDARRQGAKKGTPTPDARRQQGWGRWDTHSRWGRWDTHSEAPMGYPLDGRWAMADGTTTPGSPTPANRRDLEQRLQ